MCSSPASLILWHSPPDNVLKGCPRAQVVQADIAHGFQDRTHIFETEKLQGLGHGHFQHIGDGLAVQPVAQDLVLESLAAARPRTAA